VLAMLAKEPSQGSQLRARLDQALGPLGEAMNDGQIYVTLRRLEKAGLVTREGPGAARRIVPTARSTSSPPPARSGSPSGSAR
jgi:DNA-binding PadR family transcriptional regulator